MWKTCSVWAPQSGEYREISQMGLEFIGGQGGYAEAEAVELAVRSLAAIGPQSVLDVGHMGFITSLLDVLGVREEARAAALDALRAKNAHTLRAIAAESGCTEEEAGQLAALAALAGPFPETLDAARALVAAPGMADACGELQSLYDALEAVDAADTLRLDFSTLNDIDYYNGVVFKGYVRGVPRAVLAGGRYDNLMRRFGKPQPAVGFALYLGGLGRAFAEKSDYDVDTLLLYDAGQSPAQVARAVQSILKSGRSVRAEQSAPEGLRVRQTLRLGPGRSGPRDRRWRHMLNIALPKGRLGDKVYGLFSSIGYDCAAIYEDNRKLVFENPERGVRYLLVKPSDVAIYVEHGAADIGVVGKDVLLETQPDVYELLDLQLGRCRLAVAAKNGWQEDLSLPLRVATKYPRVAKEYYEAQGRQIEIIRLNGSIELAPILGLSDVIVDIVETGTTLKENDLGVFADVAQSSARLIANKASYQFSAGVIDGICGKLREKL